MHRTAPKPIDTVTAITAVRHVEGSVRSLVHSDLSARLIVQLRSGDVRTES